MSDQLPPPSGVCNTAYVFLRSVTLVDIARALENDFWTPAGACIHDRTDVRLT